MKQETDKPLRRHFVGIDTIVDSHGNDPMGVAAGVFVALLLLVLTFVVSKQREELQSAEVQHIRLEQPQLSADDETVAIAAPSNPEDSDEVQGDQIIESLDPLYPPAD